MLLTAELHILIFLWYVARMSVKFYDIGQKFGVQSSTAHVVIARVLDFLISTKQHIICLPNDNEKRRTANYYYMLNGIPGVIGISSQYISSVYKFSNTMYVIISSGSIDGTHIRIDRPEKDHNRNSYYNRKKYFSIHVQGVVDENLKFIDIHVGYPGSVHDARVFDETLKDTLPEFCNGESIIVL